MPMCVGVATTVNPLRVVPMLPNPTSVKLRAMRLDGMLEALEEQHRQSGISGLDFEERLGLLVERQWLWKENRALVVRLKNAQLKIANATLEDINYRHPRGSNARRSGNYAPRPGSRNIATVSSPDRPGSAKATWPARWATKPVAMNYGRATSMRPSSFAPWRRRMPTGAWPTCSRHWPGWTCSSSMTSDWRPPNPGSIATCWK